MLFCCGRSIKRQTDKYDGSTTTSEDIDLIQDEGMNLSDRLWNRAYQEKMLAPTISRIGGKRDVLSTDAPTSAEICLQRITQQYKAQGCSPYVARIKNTLDVLQPFTAAITALTQNNMYASLVWGSVLFLFQTVLKFVNFVDRVRRLLDRLNHALPRFQAYMDIIPTPRLQSALRNIYTTYLDFVQIITKTLSNNSFSLCLSLQWLTIESDFRSKEEELLILQQEFVEEVALAHVQVGVNQRQEILSRLSSRMDGPLTTGLVARNPLFVGRQAVLDTLESHLKPATADVDTVTRPRRSCVIHGVGGLGKTQVALEYTYRFRAFYSHIFWVRAESAAILRDSFLDIGRKIGIDTTKAANAKLIDLIREWLESSASNWLLVFDNVDDTETVLPFWPAGVYGNIIVTTQITDMAVMTTADIDLEAMRPDEGSELVRLILRRGDSEKDAAEQLTKELGGHPLAIAHFAGYVAKSQCFLGDILVFLQKSKRSDRVISVTSLSTTSLYQRSLNTVWDLALDRLTEDARQLLYIIAFLNPDYISEELFLGDPGEGQPGEWQYWSTDRLNDAVAVLRERHLVERKQSEQETFLLTHRALQKNILLKLDSQLELRTRIFQSALTVVRRVFPRQSILRRGDTTTWPKSRKYLPHVLNLHTAYTQSEHPILGSLVFARLLYDTGRFLFEWFWDSAAVPLLRTGMVICEGYLTSNRREVEDFFPSLLCELGLFDQNDGIKGRTRAREYIRRAIEMQERLIQEKDPGDITEADIVNLGRFYNDHGVTFLQDDIVEPSEPLFDKALATYEKVGGQAAQGVRYGHTHNHRSLSRAGIGDGEGARKFAENGCKLIREILGPESSGYLQFAMPWAVVLFNTGRQDDAFTLHKTVLELRRRVLGNGHHDTLSSLYHVAVCEQWFGQLEAAESKLRDLLTHKKTTFQWRKEDLARTAYRLSLVLSQQQRHQEAITFVKQASEMRQEWEALIPDHVGERLSPEDREMARYDYAVWIWHGRTAGKYSVIMNATRTEAEVSL